MDYKKFSSVKVTIKEMEEFYHIAGQIHNNRPYVWYMFVSSAEGIGSFLDRDHPNTSIGLSGSGVALSHLKEKTELAVGSEVDERLLHWNWAIADAVIGGAGIIRAEPDLIWRPSQKDIVYYRKRVLGKEKPPTQIVMTRKGLDKKLLSSPIFNSKDLTTIIATTEVGIEKMKKLNVNTRASIETFGDSIVDIPSVLKSLRKEHGIEHINLQGGPTLALSFLRAKLIDELRLTRSPIIIGSQNKSGEKRPVLFEGSGFGLEQPVFLEPIARRCFGNYEFLRDKVLGFI